MHGKAIFEPHIPPYMEKANVDFLKWAVNFTLVEKIAPNITDIMFTQSLNKKLGTHGLNISSIAEEGHKRSPPMNVSDVMAMVEEDGWKYSGYYHDGEAMVCSSFVTAMWKAAGIFGDTPINAVEWGPKDVYQVDIFDKNYKDTRPQQCKDADPEGLHC